MDKPPDSPEKHGANVKWERNSLFVCLFCLSLHGIRQAVKNVGLDEGGI